eukprot:scaffold125014_cov51-Attheya_sp.AAC.5
MHTYVVMQHQSEHNDYDYYEYQPAVASKTRTTNDMPGLLDFSRGLSVVFWCKQERSAESSRPRGDDGYAMDTSE